MTLLSKLSRLCLGLSGLCFLALAAQFVMLAYAGARSSAPPLRLGARAGLAADPSRMPLPREPQLAARAGQTRAESSGRAESEAPALRALVYVKREGGRAEVYINGRRAGQTPYMGDLHCKAGFPVKVELLPPKGEPLRRDVDCTPEIRVSFDRSP